MLLLFGNNGSRTRKDLQTLVAVEVPLMGEERQKIVAMADRAGLGVLFHYVRVEEKEDARALAVERRGGDAVVFVDRPEIPIVLQILVAGLAEERPDAAGCLAFAAGEFNQRPWRIPFLVFFCPGLWCV